MEPSHEEGSAESRQQEDASTSGNLVPEEIQKYVQEQTEFFNRLEALADKPVRVRRWEIIGLERTREAVVERELEVLERVETFAELREVLETLYLSLENLNIFTAINLTATEPSEGVPYPELCDVVVNVAERRRLELHVGGFIQGPQGSVDVNVGLANALGLAENLQLSWEVGKQPTSLAQIFSSGELVSEVALRASRPRVGARPINANLVLHQLTKDNQKWSSYRETMRGGLLTAQSEDGMHTLSYELGWRQLSDPSRHASHAVKQQLGHSLKSSLSYLWRHNTFNDAYFPTRGFGIRALTEVAGLWADPKALRFCKQEVSGQWVRGLSEGVVLSLSASAGLLLPWGPSFWDRPTPISERFSSGGASSNMRGFFFKGIGETDLRRRQSTMTQQNGSRSEEGRDEPPRRMWDYLGGDLQCSGMAALRFQIPWIKPLHESGFFGQVFVNASSNVLLSGQGRAPRPAVERLTDSMRYSAGVGLVWPMTIGNVELNYVRVLKSMTHDEWRHGFHIGCSADIF